MASRPSGASDDDVYQEARREYNTKFPTWNYHEVWMVLKDSPQWAAVPLMTRKSSKKTTTHNPSSGAGSSDARCHVDLNEIDDEDDDETPIEELARPPGRDRSKAAARARGQTSGKSVYEEKADQFSSQMRELLDLKFEAQKTRDLNFYFSNIDHLTGRMLEQALARKEEMVKKYDM